MTKRTVIAMTFSSKTGEIHLEYAESRVDQPILWESHCHTQYEMIAVADGDVTVMLEGQTYRLLKNQLLLIPPLFYHSLTANERGYYRRVTALFGLDAIPAALRDAFSQRNRAVSVLSFDVERIRSLCQSEDPDYYAPLLQSLMVQIFYDALASSQAASERVTDEFLEQALQYVDRHLHEKILLDDLARHTARSKSSFCHLFEEKMNISPKQYILQKKLAVAAKLIDEGVPHTVAAMQVGYDNYSSFYRLYRKNKS